MAHVASLGLLILDTFEWRFPDGSVKESRQSVLGGGGTYAVIGSRMWLPEDKIGLIVDRGNDWGELGEVQQVLDAFGDAMWIYRDQDRATTRALNLYTGQHRDFKYLNVRTQLEPIDLPPRLLATRYLHFVCSPTRAVVIQSQLGPLGISPRLVYEPIPDRCVPSELPALRTVLRHLHVFSPNHEEAAAFFGIDADEVERQGKAGVEDVARRFREEGAKFVVIRSGGWGAFTLREGEEGFWVKAYWEGRLDKVVDVTGAGNSFLGGLMAGLELDDSDARTAVQMGSISASFIIEQFGLATLSTDDAGVELWNGVAPSSRLEEMRA